MNIYGLSNKEDEAALVNLDEVKLIVWKKGELDFYFKDSQTNDYFAFKGVTEDDLEDICKELNKCLVTALWTKK